jgi:hypothetical protein
MGRKRVYSVSQIRNKLSLFKTAVPFDVTYGKEVVATVVKPQGVWRECEKCGENTQNIISYQDKEGGWQHIILCDKCNDELLG